jgi:hypothetical protein
MAMRVLLVEDYQDAREMYAVFLRRIATRRYLGLSMQSCHGLQHDVEVAAIHR